MSPLGQLSLGATLALTPAYVYLLLGSPAAVDGDVPGLAGTLGALEAVLGLGNLVGGFLVGLIGARAGKGPMVIAGFVLMAALAAPLAAQQQAGPVIQGGGKHAPVPNATFEVPRGQAYKVVWNIQVGAPKPGEANDAFNVPARFVNQGAVLGLPRESVEVAVVVHGTAITMPARLSLSAFAETMTAGRRPACSRPMGVPKSTSQISPRLRIDVPLDAVELRIDAHALSPHLLRRLAQSARAQAGAGLAVHLFQGPPDVFRPREP